MGWLIGGLFGLVLLGGLVVLARRRGRHHRAADDTLVTDLLGPRDAAAVPAPQAPAVAEPSPAPADAEPRPAPPAEEDARRPPAAPAGEGTEGPRVPRARIAAEPSPPPSGTAAEGDWLDSQLAWISEWSQRMHEQIESAEPPGTDHTE